eukprot:4794472-Alexandrium_andersonii.AAC.1
MVAGVEEDEEGEEGEDEEGEEEEDGLGNRWWEDRSDQSEQSEVDDSEEELFRERCVGRWLEVLRQLPIGSRVCVSRFAHDFVGTLSGFQDAPVSE